MGEEVVWLRALMWIAVWARLLFIQTLTLTLKE
jgi:hypothetical protein